MKKVVDKETDELIKAVATAGIIGTIAASIRALLSKDESPGQRWRTFFAGVLISILEGFILRNTTISELWKEIIIGTSAAFVSSLWPVAERAAKKWLTKKSNDVVGTDNN